MRKERYLTERSFRGCWHTLWRLTDPENFILLDPIQVVESEKSSSEGASHTCWCSRSTIAKSFLSTGWRGRGGKHRLTWRTDYFILLSRIHSTSHKTTEACWKAATCWKYSSRSRCKLLLPEACAEICQIQAKLTGEQLSHPPAQSRWRQSVCSAAGTGRPCSGVSQSCADRVPVKLQRLVPQHCHTCIFW